MSEKRPLPLFVTPHRPRCPVCGAAVFSVGGIHPQCAQSQADARSDARLKKKLAAERVAPAVQETPQIATAWQKLCPRCQLVLPARKAECQCGYTFRRTLPAADE